MNRKKTILVAVLVNAGLLIVLFATAIRTKEKAPVTTELASAPIFEEIKSSLDSAQQERKEQEFASIPNFSAFPETTEEVLFVDEPNVPIVAVPVEKPVVAAAVTQNPASNYVNVTVKKGDALEKIARANKSTVAGIMQANNMTSSALKVGQVLRVPVSGAVAQVASEPARKEDRCDRCCRGILCCQRW